MGKCVKLDASSESTDDKRGDSVHGEDWSGQTVSGVPGL